MNIGIALGYWLNDDGSISDLLIRRLKLAKELLDNKMIDYLILSGGVANTKAGRSESRAMYEYLLSIGVDKKYLLLEENSHTTDENFYFSLQIALPMNPKMIYIVSSNEHFTYYRFNPLKQATDNLNKLDPNNNIRLVIYTDSYSMERVESEKENK